MSTSDRELERFPLPPPAERNAVAGRSMAVAREQELAAQDWQRYVREKYALQRYDGITVGDGIKPGRRPRPAWPHGAQRRKRLTNQEWGGRFVLWCILASFVALVVLATIH